LFFKGQAQVILQDRSLSRETDEEAAQWQAERFIEHIENVFWQVHGTLQKMQKKEQRLSCQAAS